MASSWQAPAKRTADEGMVRLRGPDAKHARAEFDLSPVVDKKDGYEALQPTVKEEQEPPTAAVKEPPLKAEDVEVTYDEISQEAESGEAPPYQAHSYIDGTPVPHPDWGDPAFFQFDDGYQAFRCLFCHKYMDESHFYSHMHRSRCQRPMDYVRYLSQDRARAVCSRHARPMRPTGGWLLQPAAPDHWVPPVLSHGAAAASSSGQQLAVPAPVAPPVQHPPSGPASDQEPVAPTMLWNQNNMPIRRYDMARALPSAFPLQAPGQHCIMVFPGANPRRLICYIPGSGGRGTEVLDFTKKELQHARTLALWRASTVIVVEDPGKWKTPLPDWVVFLLQSLIESKPSGGRLAIVGHSRGASWSCELLQRLPPHAISAIDGLLLLAPYTRSKKMDRDAGRAMGQLLMQCGRRYVVASQIDECNPWTTYGEWLTGMQEVAGHHVRIVQHWTHEQVRAAILVGGDTLMPISSDEAAIVEFAWSVLFG